MILGKFGNFKYKIPVDISSYLFYTIMGRILIVFRILQYPAKRGENDEHSYRNLRRRTPVRP